MQLVSCKRHRFPAGVVRLAVWLRFRFTPGFRDVEAMLAHRGIEVSFETVRCWTLKFGRAFAQNLRRSGPKPTGRWHLDEMVVKIHGERMWLCRPRRFILSLPLLGPLRCPMARAGRPSSFPGRPGIARGGDAAW